MATFELVNADWLDRHRQQADIAVIDCRSAAEYWTGHIPQARHLDSTLFSVQRTDQRELARFHTVLGWALSALGLTPETWVVVVGAQNEVNASRVAWGLAYAGIARVAVLDGGAQTWKGELSTAALAVAASSFVLLPQTAYLATADEVLAASAAKEHLIDAREAAEYAGERSNARRNGRIPGATFWDTRVELDASGQFAGVTQLANEIAKVVPRGERAILYCGGGGRSARTFLAWQLAGYPDVAVYPASWNEWGNLEQYPVEAGSI